MIARAGAGAGIWAALRGVQPLSANAVSLMLTRRYHAGGGSLRTFGPHRIRHATATLLVNNGMPSRR
jgi:site-specific recombinase XerD